MAPAGCLTRKRQCVEHRTMFLAAFNPPEVGTTAAWFAFAALAVVALIVAISWILLPWVIVSKLNARKMQAASSTSAIMEQLLAMTKKMDATNAALASLVEAMARTGDHAHHHDSSGTSTASENVYYFVRDGRTEGPVNETSLRKLFNAGVVTVDTPAMKRGDADWTTVEELFPR